MAPRLTKAQQEIMEKFGLKLEEPPEETHTRRSKNYEKYNAAIELAMALPGQSIALGTYNHATQPYTLAKEINNNERPEFRDWEGGYFTAIGRRITNDDPQAKPSYGVWVTFNEGEPPEPPEPPKTPKV